MNKKGKCVLETATRPKRKITQWSPIGIQHSGGGLQLAPTQKCGNGRHTSKTYKIIHKAPCLRQYFDIYWFTFIDFD